MEALNEPVLEHNGPGKKAFSLTRFTPIRYVGRQWLRLDSSIRDSILLFSVIRMLSSILAWFWYRFPPVLSHYQVKSGEDLYHGIPAVIGGWQGLLLGVWQRWDVLWYERIAQYGYRISDNDFAFQPLYPLLVYLGAWFTKGDYLLAALLVSNLSYIAALIIFYRLVLLDYPKPVARRTLFSLVVFPTAFYLLTGYTEALLLLFTLLMFYSARRGHWVLAGLALASAVLTKITGLLLVFPFLWEYGEQHNFQWRRFRLDMLAVTLGPLALAIFYGYRWLQERNPFHPGDVGTISVTGVRITNPLVVLWAAGKAILTPPGTFPDVPPIYFAYLLLFTIGFGALVGASSWSRPRLRSSYLIYSQLFFLLSLTELSNVGPLVNIGRRLLLIFPVFIWLGAKYSSGKTLISIWIVSGLLFGLLLALYVNWYWVS